MDLLSEADGLTDLLCEALGDMDTDELALGLTEALGEITVDRISHTPPVDIFNCLSTVLKNN
jgi:hypothetical protein